MKAPAFWDAGLDPSSREAAPLTRALLTPASWLYLALLRRKLAEAQPHKARVPVICVGNLTAGGAGKTPVADAVRTRISASGWRAATLSRGHGGSCRGPLRVDAAAHTFRETGDEPLLLASSGEAWISRDRVAAATAMAAAGVEAIVMDDGHQNPALAKDLSLIVIDASAPFGNGYVLPKGPLREPVRDGLRRAGAVVLMGDGPVPHLVAECDKPLLRARLEPVAPAPSGPLVAFAGIGRPQKFFDSLAAAGADVRDAVPFGDHHAYSAGDMAFLRRLATGEGARLVTTAKDHVRLPERDRASVLAFPVRVLFETPEALDALLAPLFNKAAP